MRLSNAARFYTLWLILFAAMVAVRVGWPV
ncbi:hypothetical protein LCGC14_1708550 [marine sediment metagenome]|uniref:Uncharacterized protein n=1 Tax=marine sediment metagenome TaxID=412755 RepID=A0A0F9HFG0_9ZZZZ